MRELMRVLGHPRDERGVSAVFFALALTLLVGALGLSVDVGNVAYERTRAQHAADTAARHLAYQCAKASTGAACADLQTTAVEVAAESFEGGAVVASRAGSAVTVEVAKTIDTDLLGFIGSPTKDVAATATADLGGNATEGYPVLPLGVSYCTWKNNSSQAGTPTEASQKTLLRTDTLQGVRTLLDPLVGGVAGNLVELNGLLDALGTKAVDRCADEDGTQIGTLKGAVWITGDTVVGDVVKGLFGWEASKCELRTDNELKTYLVGLQGNAVRPQGCASQFGNGKPVDQGKTILIPIFKPYSELRSSYGLKLVSVCAGPLGAASPSGQPRTCIEAVPQLGVEIVGFAPFHVTGWKYPGGKADPAVAATCSETASSSKLSLNIYNVVNGVLTFLEKLINGVTTLLTQLLGIGTVTATISCNGLHGYFTKSFAKDPNFAYEIGGANFGSNYVKLTR